MEPLDQWLKAVGDDAKFDEAAAARLDLALAREVAPRVRSRRRNMTAAFIFAFVAGMSGAFMGGALEFSQTSAASPMMLPASNDGTVTDLLMAAGR